VLRRTALVVLAVLLIAPALPGQQTALIVVSKDDRRIVPVTKVGEQEYVGLDDLALLFQFTVREDPSGMVAVIYKGKSILLTPDQPLGSVGGRVFSLPAPTFRSNRRWLVPVDFIGRGLALVYDAKLTLRGPSHLVIVGELRVPRVQLRYDSSTNSGQAASASSAQVPSTGSGQGRLLIDATPRTASTVSQDGDQLLVRFDADAIDLVNAGAPLAAAAAQGLIQNVRMTDAVTLSFTTGPRFGGFKVTSQASDTSMRQTIDVVPASPAPAAQSEPPDSARGDSKGPDLSVLTSAGSASVLRTIAIDPGHGGDDAGVKTAGGTKEKDVTLAVARRLKALLEAKLGVHVLLTRDDDRSVPIDDRTAVANNGKADVFISLHANASWRPALAGASISTALFEHQAEQAARALPPQLVPAIGGGTRDIEFVPWDIAQIPHLGQSAMLAQLIAEQLQGHVPMAAKPIDAAPLRVLEPANMAAVLIEIGYLTNAQQEKQLSAGDFQNNFVQSIADAITRYRDAMGGSK
jgi:N-acetylmuramoyl-L-alanine amidase